MVAYHELYALFYAPNDQTQQMQFFGRIVEPIRRSHIGKIFIGGDFNCLLSASDKLGGQDVLFKKTVINAMQKLCNNSDLIDAWRQQHPQETRFTWSKSAGKIKYGLDFGEFQRNYVSTYQNRYQLLS